MKKNQLIMIVILLSFMVLSLSFESCCLIKQKEINIADSIVGLPKTALPFEYEEWLNWSSAYYSDKGVEDENRYVFIGIDKTLWFKNIYNDKREDTIIGSYYILDTGIDSIHSFVLDCVRSKSIFTILINVNNAGEVISELQLSEQHRDDDCVRGFDISENLIIKIYMGELQFDNIQDWGIIRNRKPVISYQLEQDGILKVIQ